MTMLFQSTKEIVSLCIYISLSMFVWDEKRTNPILYRGFRHLDGTTSSQPWHPRLVHPLKSNGNWYPYMMGRMEKVVLRLKIWPFLTSMLDFWGVKNGGVLKMIFLFNGGRFAGSTAQFSRVKHANTSFFLWVNLLPTSELSDLLAPQSFDGWKLKMMGFQ